MGRKGDRMFNSKRRKKELKELEELRLRIKEYEELETAGLEELQKK